MMVDAIVTFRTVGLQTPFNATVITRMKTTFKYQVLAELNRAADPVNEGVVSDQLIQLRSSNEVWRLIRFIAPSGEDYEYLTNDFALTPGIIAFLYHRR